MPVRRRIVEPQPEQQRHGGQPADQVQHDDQRLHQPPDRQRAERALEHDGAEHHQRIRQAHRPLPAVRDRDRRDQHDDEAERGRRVAVDHLAPGLALIELPAGRIRRDLVRVLRGRGRRHVAVAARPVGAAEAGVGEPHPGAEHDDRQAEQHAEQRQAADQRRGGQREGSERVGGGVHGIRAFLDHVPGINRSDQPMCDSFSSFFMSDSRPFGFSRASKRIIRLPSGSTM